MKKLSEIEYNALIEVISPKGASAILARKSDVKADNFSRYKRTPLGELEVELETWIKLYPHLKAHLPPDYPSPLTEQSNLSFEEELLLSKFREFSHEEKKAAVQEFIIKAENEKDSQGGLTIRVNFPALFAEFKTFRIIKKF